jgi:hypothetical protein
MLGLYKENIYDLFNPETKYSDIKMKEHPKKGLVVTNLTEKSVTKEDEFITLIEKGLSNAITKTDVGSGTSSSRSHIVLQVEISKFLNGNLDKKGKLNLIDLVGSENVI